MYVLYDIKVFMPTHGQDTVAAKWFGDSPTYTANNFINKCKARNSDILALTEITVLQ
jgi:hypothetical protein